MTYYETLQQGPMHQHAQFNPQQWAMFNPQNAQGYGAWLGVPSIQGIGLGLGQAAYGQQYGQFGGQPQWWGQWGYQQPQWGQQWGQQRQLSQHEVHDVVRQLLPALPQILAQAQQQPHLAYAAYGQGYGFGYGPRALTPQDVNEVVRQIMPILPQIVGALQSQPQLQHAAMHGGGGWGQGMQGAMPGGGGMLGGPQSQFSMGGLNPYASPYGSYQQFGQYGWPQFQSAFGGQQHWGFGQQRQLTQQDVADVTRQLVALIPQVIGNLQAFNQQRMI
jgi:hypothetical protein